MTITNYKFNKDSSGVVSGVHPYIDGQLATRICIPLAEGNRDYEEYKVWVAAGNTAEDAD